MKGKQSLLAVVALSWGLQWHRTHHSSQHPGTQLEADSCKEQSSGSSQRVCDNVPGLSTWRAAFWLPEEKICLDKDCGLFWGERFGPEAIWLWNYGTSSKESSKRSSKG